MNFARESIIVSAVRTFCTSFAAVLGILIGFFLIVMALGVFSTPDIYPPESKLVIAADAEGNRNLLSHSAPVLLKLDIVGEIGMKDLTEQKITNLLLDTHEGILSHNRVKGILLHINTPGGTVDDSEGIYHALKKYKEKYQIPIYAFVDGMCASGGMYIASSADQIWTTPTSIIGSVGVLLGPAFNFSGLMEKIGVQSLALTEGKDKDMLNPYRPWQPGEDASMKIITAELYNRFLSIVTAARPRLSRDKLVNEYGAQVYVAKQAKEYGYIDESDADYSSAIAALAKAAQIGEGEQYQVFNIEMAHSFISELVQSKFSLLSGKITHTFPVAPFVNSEMSGRFLYLYQP